MKKGFTIIEIIITISLILIIGTIGIIALNNRDDSKNTNNIIFTAAKSYVNTEADNDGNSYMNGILTYGKGVKIPLKELKNEGYIEENLVNEIYEKYDSKTNRPSDKDYYVLVANAGEGTDYCQDNSTISISGSWMEGDTTYLCNTKPMSGGSATTLLDKIKLDNGGEIRELDLDNMSNDDLFDDDTKTLITVNSSLSLEDGAAPSPFRYGDCIDDNYGIVEEPGSGEKLYATSGTDGSLCQYQYSSKNNMRILEEPVEIEVIKNKYNGLYKYNEVYFYRGNIANNFIAIGNDEVLFRIISISSDNILIIPLNVDDISKVASILTESQLTETQIKQSGCSINSTWSKNKYYNLNYYGIHSLVNDVGPSLSTFIGAVNVLVNTELTFMYEPKKNDCWFSQFNELDGAYEFVDNLRTYYQANGIFDNTLYFKKNRNIYKINYSKIKYESGIGTINNPYKVSIDN